MRENNPDYVTFNTVEAWLAISMSDGFALLTAAHIRLGGMILLVLHAPVGRWITG